MSRTGAGLILFFAFAASLPEIATYIEDASDLVFDTKCDIEVNYDHLFDDNREWLPDVLRVNRTLVISAMQGSIEPLKEKVRRNLQARNTTLVSWSYSIIATAQSS